MDDDNLVDGKRCPSCQRDIGVWPILTAGLPNRIWCPHCHARLSYRFTSQNIAILVWVAILVCAISVCITVVVAPRNIFFDRKIAPDEALALLPVFL